MVIIPMVHETLLDLEEVVLEATHREQDLECRDEEDQQAQFGEGGWGGGVDHWVVVMGLVNIGVGIGMVY